MMCIWDTRGICCCHPSLSRSQGTEWCQYGATPEGSKWNMGGGQCWCPKHWVCFYSGLIFRILKSSYQECQVKMATCITECMSQPHLFYVTQHLLLSAPREVLVHSGHDSLESILKSWLYPGNLFSSPGSWESPVISSTVLWVVSNHEKKKVYKWLP